MKFSPPLKHPNVSLDGTVSIPYLDNWRSSSQLKGLISSIYKILKSPLIEESVNLEAVYEYVSQKIQVRLNYYYVTLLFPNLARVKLFNLENS